MSHTPRKPARPASPSPRPSPSSASRPAASSPSSASRPAASSPSPASRPAAPAPRPAAPRTEADEAHRWASRGGLKLDAAVREFGLAGFIKDAECIDVGASTGGFTDVLLHYGARRVTAVDVGHGQLVERLRNDPRVEVIEDFHIKLAPLHVAPGPYSFFVVDVSFMAARTVLKPLARRLAVGARGVVLVKPQFELPDTLVPRGGVVESRNLRKLAFNRFKKKVPERGFELLGRINSPVAGAAGNIEFLAFLRYTGVVATPSVEADGD